LNIHIILSGGVVMPRGDGTGPAGMGPMTGRAAGYCAGYSVPGYMNPIPGRGGFWGTGAWGRGRGYRHMYYATGLPYWARGAYAPTTAPGYTYPPVNPYYGAAPVSKEDQVKALQAQADMLSKSLEDVNKAISDLEKESSGQK